MTWGEIMKAMVVLFLSLLALLPVAGWAEQEQFSDWRAEAHVGKLGQRDYGKVRTPTIQGPKHVFLEYDCARFIPMLTAEKGVTFPHGGPTECNANGCVAIQFADAQLDSGSIDGTMMFVDPLRPDKVSFHLPFSRRQLEASNLLKIEMYTGNAMAGDRNTDLYTFSLSGFTKAAAWCDHNRDPGGGS